MKCVCGHAEFLHTNCGCLKWFLGCGCPAYQPEDGNEHGGPSTVVRNEHYEGRYGGRYSA